MNIQSYTIICKAIVSKVEFLKQRSVDSIQSVNVFTSTYKFIYTYFLPLCALTKTNIVVFLDINECNAPDIYPCYSDCNNTQGGYHCQCPPGFTGNASMQNGCKDIDECIHPEEHSCYGLCINMQGTFRCLCRDGTYGDPSKKGGCVTPKSSISGVTIGLVVSGGSILLLLALAAPFITRRINLLRVNKLKERCFKQNHGLLLQQLYHKIQILVNG